VLIPSTHLGALRTLQKTEAFDYGFRHVPEVRGASSSRPGNDRIFPRMCAVLGVTWLKDDAL